jgi:hypothetical protein
LDDDIVEEDGCLLVDGERLDLEAYLNSTVDDGKCKVDEGDASQGDAFPL